MQDYPGNRGGKALATSQQRAIAEQFSEGRLSAANAMCDRLWDHSKQSSGELPAWALRLPHELAEVVLKKRSSQSQLSVLPAQSESEAAHVHLDASATDFPTGVQQIHHAGQGIYGFRRGCMVAEAPPQQSIAPTDQEFAARPVTPGCFVVTRPALPSHLG